MKLVEGKTGLSRDVPTIRDRRHIEELIQAKETGNRAALIFVVQRDDADSFSPNDQTDPALGRTLRRAVNCGVETYAYTCHVRPTSISLQSSVSVLRNCGTKSVSPIPPVASK